MAKVEMIRKANTNRIKMENEKLAKELNTTVEIIEMIRKIEFQERIKTERK